MMRIRLLVLAAAALALLAGVVMQQVASAEPPDTGAASAAVTYIEGLQNSDGGFPAFGSDSTPGSTLDAVFALVAAGVGPATVTSGGHSPADYLSSQAATYVADPGGAAKLALGVSAMGLDAGAFGGLDLWAMLDTNVDSSHGAYGNDLFDEVLYVLALESAGRSVPAAVLSHLEAAQVSDGGWEFQPDAGSDSNTTALALQALIGDGVATSAAAITNGIAYLHTVQNDDGGFAFVASGDSDANSTALVVQALAAAGEDIETGGPWDRNGHTPLAALVSWQNVSTGAVQYSGADSPFATYQAVPGFMLAPFPDLRTRILVHPTPEPTSTVPTATSAATATATATPVSIALPRSGSARGGPGIELGSITLLLLAGVGAGAAGVIGRRAR
jgi:hypothetical protein